MEKKYDFYIAIVGKKRMGYSGILNICRMEIINVDSRETLFKKFNINKINIGSERQIEIFKGPLKPLEIELREMQI